MEILSLLLHPEVLVVLGPIGLILAIGNVVLYRMYMAQLEKNDTLQEKRIDEVQRMQKSYDELQEKRVVEAQHMQSDFLEFSQEMSQTLDAVIQTIREFRKGG